MRFFRLAVLLVAALFTGAAVAEDIPVFKLVAKDGKFEPSVLEVPAGKRFRIEVSNEGKKAIEFESKDLKQEKVVAPGKAVTVNVGALKPGEYTFFDEFQETTSRGKVVAK